MQIITKNGSVLVGHGISNDLDALQLNKEAGLVGIPYIDTGDLLLLTQKKQSLAHLCEQHLNVRIQMDSHSSIQDARATMALFLHFKSFLSKCERRLILKKNESELARVKRKRRWQKKRDKITWALARSNKIPVLDSFWMLQPSDFAHASHCLW